MCRNYVQQHASIGRFLAHLCNCFICRFCKWVQKIFGIPWWYTTKALRKNWSLGFWSGWIQIVCFNYTICWFCFSLGVKVPSIVAEAKKCIDEGFCVVIGLQTTGEVWEYLMQITYCGPDTKVTLLALHECSCWLLPIQCLRWCYTCI